MRLIDADNLDFTFDRRCFSEGDTQYVRGVDDAIGVVNNAPTIDPIHAAGGCYCWECKFFREWSINDHYCANRAGLSRIVSADEFCSRGKRKETANE